MNHRIDVAILGSGNIGTDLLQKIVKRSKILRPVFMAGIEKSSEGLMRARRLGVKTTDKGLAGLIRDPGFKSVKIVFDATSAKAHREAAPQLKALGKIVVDMTPAAVGPYCVPIVNLDQMPECDNVNMVSCGGQATVPIVAAVSRVAPVAYAEIVAMISSKSAGPGTRANIDEFTETTSKALETVGGAGKGKAIIILNPADPPLMMRNTVYCIVDEAAGSAKTNEIAASIRDYVAKVAEYVPGYKLANGPVFAKLPETSPYRGYSVATFLEVTGVGDFLPAYAGNLDIMTSAALACGEKIARRIESGRPSAKFALGSDPRANLLSARNA